MGNIRSVIAGVTVVAAGVTTVAVLAETGTATAGTPSSGTFTVRAHHGSETNIDLGKHGFSAGDQDLFTGTLTRHGKKVGRLVGGCTTARVGRTTADQLCEFVLHLGKAQINASGSTSSTAAGPGTFVLPIVGGTGRYDRARGEIAVTATNGKSFPIAVSVR